MAFFNQFGRNSRGRGSPRGPPSPANENAPSPVSPNPSAFQGGAREPGQKPLYLCSPFVEAALVKGNFKTIVMLPKYVDTAEWVAVNIFDFYTNLNMFYGIISECCTTQSCQTMTGGPGLSYTWVNADRRSVNLPAPTYIDYVMTWIQNLLDDPNMFPIKSNAQFPNSFAQTIKHVYRQMLRVFSHIYFAHYHQLLHLRSEPHFNSLFAHFLAFGREYDLVDVKDLRGDGKSPALPAISALWERWKEMGILEG